MRSLLVIYGCHGAGKTTLAKNILLSDGNNLSELSTEFGKITVSENKRYVAVGKYSIKCGGADSVSSVKNYFQIIEYLLKNYPDSKVIVEGIFLSALWQTPLKEFLRLKYEFNCGIEQVLLFTTVKSSYNRVFGRNNRQPNLKNIQNKQKTVVNTFKKMAGLREFTNFVIDTENKTIDEVFNEFLSQSKFIQTGAGVNRL